MAENNDNDRTDRIRRSRTEDSTKRIYAGKLEIVVEWFRRNFPQYVVDNSMQYDQIPDNLWEDLFSYLSRPKEGRRRRKRGDYLSFEHVSGYKSAIIDDLKSKKLRVSENMQDTFTTYFAGYKRVIAQEVSQASSVHVYYILFFFYLYLYL